MNNKYKWDLNVSNFVFLYKQAAKKWNGSSFSDSGKKQNKIFPCTQSYRFYTNTNYTKYFVIWA